jgi:GxxExxY protein
MTGMDAEPTTRPDTVELSRAERIPTTEANANQRDPLTAVIIGAAITVHRYLGPGLLESAYRDCMCCELGLRGLAVARERVVPLIYKGTRVDVGFRADLIVNERVLVELKAVERLVPIHTAQTLTYLGLSGLRVGLLLNFNVPFLREGIVRLVL